jgi:hypothetical protein
MYMIYNIYLSQLRNHSRDIVIEPIYSVSVLDSIVFCLLDIISLYLEKVIFLRYLPLAILYYILIDYFNILLPLSDFKKSLVSIILYLDLIAYI